MVNFKKLYYKYIVPLFHKKEVKENMSVVLAKYFMPLAMKKIIITEDDKKKYLEWDERWLHKEEVDDFKFMFQTSGFSALVRGKQRAWIHVAIYEQGILDGSMPYYVIFDEGKLDIAIVKYLAWTLFKGKYRNDIMNQYYLLRWETNNIIPILSKHDEELLKYL